MEDIVLKRKCILKPVKECDWASEMVLNPSLIEDPNSGRLHMLVRVSGPVPEKKLEGKPMPFPISFAYGYSDDGGENFTFDFSRPALTPALEYELDKMYIVDGQGNKVPNYVNGCIEDPRTFFIEGECYCAIAGRMFPAGPYWVNDNPVQCMPDWAREYDSPIGNQGNVTTTVLYKIDLDALAQGEYEKAFTYITDLTDPSKGEDRDVFIFPNKMRIDGKMQYVMIQRPHHPDRYDEITENRPAMVISAAEDLYSFAKHASRRTVLYAPELSWQDEKVGLSAPPIKVSEDEWLVNFHGKKDIVEGYAQSFMILKEQENDFPIITHLYPEKWITDRDEFEKPRKFKTPCVFFTGCIQKDDKLIISYGAADEYAAIMEIDLQKTMDILRQYPYGDK